MLKFPVFLFVCILSQAYYTTQSNSGMVYNSVAFTTYHYYDYPQKKSNE